MRLYRRCRASLGKQFLTVSGANSDGPDTKRSSENTLERTSERLLSPASAINALVLRLRGCNNSGHAASTALKRGLLMLLRRLGQFYMHLALSEYVTAPGKR